MRSGEIEAHEIPNFTTAATAASALFVFVISMAFVNTSLPFFAGLSAAIVVFLICITWNKDRKRTWPIIFIIASIHGLLLYLIDFQEEISFGIAFLPAALIEVWFANLIIGKALS